MQILKSNEFAYVLQTTENGKQVELFLLVEDQANLVTERFKLTAQGVKGESLYLMNPEMVKAIENSGRTLRGKLALCFVNSSGQIADQKECPIDAERRFQLCV